MYRLKHSKEIRIVVDFECFKWYNKYNKMKRNDVKMNIEKLQNSIKNNYLFSVKSDMLYNEIVELLASLNEYEKEKVSIDYEINKDKTEIYLYRNETILSITMQYLNLDDVSIELQFTNKLDTYFLDSFHFCIDKDFALRTFLLNFIKEYVVCFK